MRNRRTDAARNSLPKGDGGALGEGMPNRSTTVDIKPNYGWPTNSCWLRSVLTFWDHSQGMRKASHDLCAKDDNGLLPSCQGLYRDRQSLLARWLRRSGFSLPAASAKPVFWHRWFDCSCIPSAGPLYLRSIPADGLIVTHKGPGWPIGFT